MQTVNDFANFWSRTTFLPFDLYGADAAKNRPVGGKPEWPFTFGLSRVTP